MFLIEPDRSPYDLNFSLLGIPVRVHPWFWIITAMLGWSAIERDISFLLAWIVCVFVSILVHEMGHVLMGQVFGTRGSIVLYSFGGLAVGSSDLRDPWKRIAVYFAGPLAGFVLFGVIAIVYMFLDKASMSELMLVTMQYVLVINLFWGILNLFPILPLDGGQISREICTKLSPNKGLRIALGISTVVAAILAGCFLYLRSIYSAIMFGLLAYSSYQAMQQLPPRGQSYEEDRQPWERDSDSWRR